MTNTPLQVIEIAIYPSGVDFEEGIRRIANNKKLYDKLLFRIASELPKNIAEFESSAAANDFENLSAQAHSLKGSSANLSIETLQKASAALEIAAKSQNTLEVSKAIEELKIQSNAYISELQQAGE